MFVHRTRVRFADVDAAGIVFFAKFFDYAHAAFEESMRAAGLSIAERLRAGDVGLPLVHAEADYHAPAAYDEALEVAVEVARIGETSASFTFRIAGPDGAPRATVRTTHVCVERRTFRPIAWPEAMRRGLESMGR
jgi:1,4-dihydroxy-2-naphthoyl-CoA hydrolase